MCLLSLGNLYSFWLHWQKAELYKFQKSASKVFLRRYESQSTVRKFHHIDCNNFRFSGFLQRGKTLEFQTSRSWWSLSLRATPTCLSLLLTHLRSNTLILPYSITNTFTISLSLSLLHAHDLVLYCHRTLYLLCFIMYTLSLSLFLTHRLTYKNTLSEFFS